MDATVEVDRIKAIFEAIDGRAALRIDANQGWSKHVAVVILTRLADQGVSLEFVEQPVAAWDLDGMRWVRERCPFPIVADECVGSTMDVYRVANAGAADMVNLKVMKCGGLAAVVDAVAVAAAAGLPSMIGSMLEMPGMVAAAVALASTLPWVDAHDLDAGWWLDPASATPDWPRYEPPLVCWDGTSDSVNTHSRVGRQLQDQRHRAVVAQVGVVDRHHQLCGRRTARC